MNVKQFAALKVGDKIENPALGGSQGEVVEVTGNGVRLVWGPRHEHETRFFYAVNNTAWMQWNLVEPS